MFEILKDLSRPGTWAGLMFVALTGCVTELPVTAESTDGAATLVLGRVTTVLTGERRRIYEPMLRTFELENQQTLERFRVDVQSDDQEQGALTYLGTWRFGVDSPRYGRMVVLSMIVDEQDKAQAEQIVKHKYPAHELHAVVTVLPDPTKSEARLYEVMPYPRYPQYFQRHYW